jgi:MFS family permease
MTSTTASTGGVLATLGAGQFVMAIDSTAMNVSIVAVAQDVGTDITGVQTAITAYTLVMASLMVTGGKIGQMIGHKKAFLLGAAIYASGSLTTALAPNLVVLLIGWSLLEGIGAALILPAIVSLVATNVPIEGRGKAYGLVAAAGAIAVAVGPLLGGLFTTYLSWRWVFAGEVVLVAVIIVAARGMVSSPPDSSTKLDVPGAVLSALGLGLLVFGILRAGVWGFVSPKPGSPEVLGLSVSFVLMVAGAAVLWLFVAWEQRVAARGHEPLVDTSLLRVAQLRTGLSSAGFQFFLQSGLFYLISLYLSVAVGLSAIGTGARLMPLSITLLAGAVLVPRLFPTASPRRVVRLGFVFLIGGVLLLIVLLHFGDGPGVVSGPLVLAGLGIGTLASQIANVTVASVPEDRSGEVGGLQNTATNLGASVATALAGAVLVATLTTGLIQGLSSNPDVPDELLAAAEVELSAGVPFLSDVQLDDALAASGLDETTAAAIKDENADARIAALRTALGVIALAGVAALFVSRRMPEVQPGSAAPAAA